MIKRPGRSPHNEYVRRVAAFENEKARKRRTQLTQPVWLRGISALARGIISGLLSLKRAMRRSARTRYSVIGVSTVVVIAVLLLVLLAPRGETAVVSNTLPAAMTSSPTAYSTQSATAPDPTITADPSPTASPTQSPSESPSESPTPDPTKAPSKPKTTDMDKLVSYYCVEADSYYSDSHYSSNHYEYTDDELKIMAQIIQAEAGGEPYEGKVAIGNVIINRVLSGHYANTIAGQTKGLAYHPDIVPRQACIDAAHAVLDDEYWVVPQNTYNFKNSGGDWRSFTYWGKIGHQYFYTYHYGKRNNGKSIPSALFKRVYKYPQYGCIPSERVGRIQYMLKSLGYDVTPDKRFGMDTKKALMAFQKDKGLKADGVAGPTTVKALIRAFGVDKYCKKYS